MKIKKSYLYGIAILLGVMLLAGSFYDLQISQTIYHPTSIFGIFFASFGQLPAMLSVSVGSYLLFRSTSKDHKVTYILSIILAVFLHLFAIMGITMDPMLYIPNMNIFISLIIAVLIVVIVDYLITRWIKEADARQLKRYGLALLFVMFTQIILINIIKVQFSRPRMRMLDIQGF